jgi:hypothetical protein
MLVQIDQFGGAFYRTERCLFDSLWWTDKGDHCAIVIQVGVTIQNAHSSNA